MTTDMILSTESHAKEKGGHVKEKLSREFRQLLTLKKKKHNIRINARTAFVGC